MGGYNGNGVLPNQNITTASQQQRLSPAQMTQAQPQPQPQRVSLKNSYWDTAISIFKIIAY